MVAVKLLRALLANSILVLPTASGTNGTLQAEFVVTWTIIIIIILCLSGFYQFTDGGVGVGYCLQYSYSCICALGSLVLEGTVAGKL